MTKGRANASAKGQPKMAPVANDKVAANVLLSLPSFAGAMEAANAKVDAYIANDDGRRASKWVRPVIPGYVS